MKTPLIISACFLGRNVKYNGGNNLLSNIKELEEYFELIPICPETEGGLNTPRNPSEIIGDKVFSNIGEDVTTQFRKGASIALERAIKSGAKLALLKSKSPSCGNGLIYDGAFSGKLTVGDGIATSLLKEHGIMVFTENEIEQLFQKIA